MLVKHTLVLCCIGAIANVAFAQGSQQRPNAVPPTPVMQSSFSAEGLATESTLTKMFAGDFLGIDFDRNDVKFNGLFDQYLVAYSGRCTEALPVNRVEMTRQECSSSTVTEVRSLRWGTLISSTETCDSWRTVHVGWAKPELYSAKKMVDRQRALDVGRELSRTLTEMTGPNAMNNVMAKLAAAIAVSGDMDALVRMNGCRSPGLQRFEDNLRLFALNQQPIRLDGKSLGAAVAVSAENPFKDSDYARLMTDFVEDDATKWGGFAKYVRGSVARASVSTRDDQGRPVRIVASYMWDGPFGRNRGNVTLTFTDGLPNCFFYSETPAVCHAANRKIVAAYVNGAYQR